MFSNFYVKKAEDDSKAFFKNFLNIFFGRVYEYLQVIISGTHKGWVLPASNTHIKKLSKYLFP